MEIEGQYHNVYVIKRPGVDQFMKRVGELYEVVVFTASVSKVGDSRDDVGALVLTPITSTEILCSTNWTFTMSCIIACFGKVATTTKATTSRFAIPLHPQALCTFAALTVLQDLSQVGRDLKETIIIDNSPTSYIFHPQHAVPISSWFSDAHDNELLDLIPVLEDLAGSQVRDVSLVLDVAL